MNFKKLILMFSIFLTLILTVGVISATQDLESNSTDITTDNNNVTQDIDVNSNQVNTTTSTKEKSVSQSKKEKIKTKVDADKKAIAYKKNSYFKIEVEYKNKDIKVKNVMLKVKVGTGSNAKTFNIKTNSHGIAKFNTKNLKIGTHKVKITSGDDKYSISKTSKIYVGKQYTKTLKTTSKKVLKNKDVVSLKIKKNGHENEVKVVLKKAKFTKIIKAKFYLKNKITGKIVVKTDYAEFEDGKWDLPDEDFSNKYTLTKVKVFYISIK